MQLVVKVDLARTKDPAGHVRRLAAAAAPGATAEEVFPGQRDGASAGLVTLRLPPRLAQDRIEACLDALRADPAVQYAQPPPPRRAR